MIMIKKELSLKETFFKMDKLMLSTKGKKELIKLHSQSLKDDEKLKEKNVFNLLPIQPLTHYNSGCTACVCVIDTINKKIYFANIGDSRGILIKNNIAKKITIDHNPSNQNENNRIINAGGKIIDNRIFFDNGAISVSRSLGDLDFKRNKSLSKENQIITANPDILIEDLNNECDFIVIACDGIWDCLSNCDICNFIKEKLFSKEFQSGNLKLSGILECLFDNICAKDFDKGDFVILCCDGVWECFDNEQMMFNFIFENLNKNNNGDLDKVIGYMFDNIIGKNSQTDFSGFDNMSCIVIQIK